MLPKKMYLAESAPKETKALKPAQKAVTPILSRLMNEIITINNANFTSYKYARSGEHRASSLEIRHKTETAVIDAQS